MLKNPPHLKSVEGAPFGASWLIDAPWAHPAWSQYAILLYDLTTPTGQPPKLYLEEATHEFILYAVDPSAPVGSVQELKPGQMLEPPNHGYQFAAGSNEEAVARIQQVVDAIGDRRLSPDTDFRVAWDDVFQDGASLRRLRGIVQ